MKMRKTITVTKVVIPQIGKYEKNQFFAMYYCGMQNQYSGKKDNTNFYFKL